MHTFELQIWCVESSLKSGFKVAAHADGSQLAWFSISFMRWTNSTLPQVFVQAESTGESLASWLNKYWCDVICVFWRMPKKPWGWKPTYACCQKPEGLDIEVKRCVSLCMHAKLDLRSKPTPWRTFFLPSIHLSINSIKTARKVLHANVHGWYQSLPKFCQ